MNNEPAKILLVDDEPNLLKSLSRILKSYSITTATSGPEALALARSLQFDLVISDYRMPEMDGITFLEKFIAIQPNAVRIVYTAYADLEAAQKAINTLGVYRFLDKSSDTLEISRAVEQGLELKRILLENQILADQARDQQARLKEQEAILKTLETEEPGITHVNWGPDGSIILDESDFDEEL